MAGVLVTFHPDADFDRRLQAIARETRPVIVVDNSADAQARERLAVICAAQGAELIANPSNRGLGAALNQGFRRCAELGLAFAYAFDQDSTPAPGFAEAAFALMSDHPRVGIVGANWHDEARPDFASRHLRRHRAVPGCFERVVAARDLPDVTCVITSGSMFRIAAWRQIGGFDEDLFLDLVDTDYCLRVRKSGYTIAVASGARLAHRRGAKQPVRWGGRIWWPAFMPPLRLRYLFRNRMRLIARHGWRQPHWVAFEAVYACKILCEVLLEDRTAGKLVACARGTWDGLLGRGGRIDAA
jgi:rhamnosyltransferase